MVKIKDLVSPETEKIRIGVLFIGTLVILLSFFERFPRESISVEMPAIGYEAHFGGVWESDAAGAFVWVLNEKNKIIIANNENVKKSGQLDVQIVGAPCGDSHEVTITSRFITPQRLSVSANQKSEVQIPLTLDPYARVPMFVNVSGNGCRPSATDARFIKVQFRLPIFVPS